jgi:PAS domain S-box-containing protein
MPSVFDTDALYRLLVDQVEDYAIFALDTAGCVCTWNTGAERFKGYKANEIIGKDFAIFYPKEARDRGLPRQLLKRAAETGHALDEGWRVRKDGTQFWASVTITVLRDDAGAHVGFAKITRDLTERRQAEEKQRQLAAEEAAHAVTSARNQELELAHQLQEQALELEAQNDEAQSLAEELEQTNEQLQGTLAEAEETRDALAISERFSRGILESITDPFVVLDAGWHYRFVNTPAAAMMEPSRHVQPGGLIGQSMWAIYPDIIGTDFEREMRQAAAEGRPRSFEAFYPRRGEWSVLHCYPLPDGGLAVQWRDVTERKRVEEANHYLTRASDLLNRSLSYEETLNDVAQLMVPRLADWCVVSIAGDNGRLEQLAVAHVDPAKMELARALNERYPADPGDATGEYNVLRTGRSELYADIPDHLLAAGARDAEHLRITRELGLRSAMIVPLSVGDMVLGVLSLVSAESERHYDQRDLRLAEELGHRAAMAVQNARLHRAALEAQREAEEANKAKSKFLATMSHELRTPLNAIAGYVDLLRLGVKGPVSPQQDDYLARIGRSERYLLALIQDVLSFAKIEAGRVELRLEDAAVAPLVDEVTTLVMPQLRDAQLALHVEPCAPTIGVRADPERATQIILNVLGNAIKFTRPGGSIRISCVADDRTVRVRVHDTGIGIPREKLGSIFEPFVQLERNDPNGRAGSGLGLAISRDLARAMGGDLTAESAPGEGSTFTLSLPRVSIGGA